MDDLALHLNPYKETPEPTYPYVGFEPQQSTTQLSTQVAQVAHK